MWANLLHGSTYMSKSLSMLVLAALVVTSVAMAMSSRESSPAQVDEARVAAQIDARLHAVLLKLRQQKMHP